MTQKLRPRAPWDESVDSRRFPMVSQVLGVDGRDKPSHDGHSVASGISGGAAALHRAFLEHVITRGDGVILARYRLVGRERSASASRHSLSYSLLCA